MRDDEGGAALEQRLQRLLDQDLGMGVDGGGRFIQNQDLRVIQQRAGEGDQLLLPGGKAAAALVDLGVVALFHRQDGVVDVHRFGCGDDLFFRRVQLAVADVVHDRAGEDEAVLHHDRHLLAQGVQVYVAHIVTVNLHRAAVHIVEAGDQVDYRGFARARRADQRDGLAGIDVEGDILEDHLFRVIGEGHIVKVHMTLDGRQVGRTLLGVDLNGRIEDFKDALGGGHRHQHVVVEVGKVVQRLPEAAQVPQNQQQRAHRDLACGHVRPQHRHAEDVDQHRADG